VVICKAALRNTPKDCMDDADCGLKQPYEIGWVRNAVFRIVFAAKAFGQQGAAVVNQSSKPTQGVCLKKVERHL